jgi:penicillin-binding protein 1A
VKLQNVLLFFIITIVCCVSFLCGIFFFISHHHTIDFTILSSYDSKKSTLVVDDEGNEWTRFQFDKRDPVDEAAIPAQVINAFVAAEDWHFFSHHGISWKGIIRSLFINIYYGRKAQGASTITQQLVKLLFFDAQKTFSRKIKEQLYAILVEQQFTKEQIIQTYLNHVCFGCGIYGIEAASQRFWNKHAHDLSLDEAATLAGIIRSPARYCPLMYPLSAEKRRNVILGKMKYLGFISDNEYEQALQKTVEVKDKVFDSFAPHVKEMVRVQLEELFGKTALYKEGLIVKTTINKKMQLAAQKAFTEEIMQLRKHFNADIDGGMMVIDRKTGEIKALVGGFDFCASKFNRVTQAHRQIGSTFKPLLYSVALETGMHCTDIDIDEPLELVHNNVVWAPRNYNKKFNGLITLAYALSHSNNIVSIKTFLRIDPHKVIALAKKCRMKGNFHTYPSLALGCIDGTLFEVAGMFNIFANDGVYVEPHIVSWVRNCWGTRLYKVNPERERVVESAIIGQIASVLGLGLKRVKKLYSKNNWISSEAISKTGTTNDSRTCWFVGSTPSLTVAIYVGFDDNRSMGENVFPIKTAFPIWFAFNKVIESPEKTFSFDPSLKTIIIDERTGELSTIDKPGAIAILVS